MTNYQARMENRKAYQDMRLAIAATITKINELLAEHEAESHNEPSNWGYAADLCHVDLKLTEIVDFLSDTEAQDES
jgi:hypothetical protein